MSKNRWANNLRPIWAPHGASVDTPQRSVWGVLRRASYQRQEHTNCYALLRLRTREEANLGKLQLLSQKKFVKRDAFLYTVVHPNAGSFNCFQSKKSLWLQTTVTLRIFFQHSLPQDLLWWENRLHARSNKHTLPLSFYLKLCQDHLLCTSHFLLHSLKQH